MIRYTIISVLLLLASFVLQQFMPAFTGLYDSRILLVQLVFLCMAVTVTPPTMLLLAFMAGFLWDAQCALGPQGGDAEIYNQPVEALRFGYSILLFGAMGFLMQGVQPLFKQGKWQFSAFLSGIAVFLYLAAEYMIISFVRGGIVITRSTLQLMLFSSLLTMLFSPLIFGILFFTAKIFNHPIYQEDGRKPRRSF